MTACGCRPPSEIRRLVRRGARTQSRARSRHAAGRQARRSRGVRARRRCRADRKRRLQRQTRDLDFFGLTRDAVDRLAPAVRRALSAAGLTVGHAQVNPGFARFIVSDGDERTELDLAADARLFHAESGRIAPTLTGEELAVDKVLAV